MYTVCNPDTHFNTPMSIKVISANDVSGVHVRNVSRIEPAWHVNVFISFGVAFACMAAPHRFPECFMVTTLLSVVAVMVTRPLFDNARHNRSQSFADTDIVMSFSEESKHCASSLCILGNMYRKAACGVSAMMVIAPCSKRNSISGYSVNLLTNACKAGEISNVTFCCDGIYESIERIPTPPSKKTVSVALPCSQCSWGEGSVCFGPSILMSHVGDKVMDIIWYMKTVINLKSHSHYVF